MGAIAGVLAGIGERVHEENQLNMAAQLRANDDLAKLMEKQAESAGTEADRLDYYKRAAHIRSLGSKKPPKEMDLHNIFMQRNKAALQAQLDAQKQGASQQAQQTAQQRQAAQAVVQQGITPPNPDNVQGAAGGMSQAPQVPTGVSGIAAGLPPPEAQKKTTDLAAPSPAAWGSSSR